MENKEKTKNRNRQNQKQKTGGEKKVDYKCSGDTGKR